MSVILSDVRGFTPVIDVVAKKLGFITAGVYGLVWRHCQMSNRICTASVETLAGMLDVSPKTIRRHLKILVENGYIIDKTPELLNRPHIYQDAAKVKIEGLIQATEVGQKVQPISNNDVEVGQKVHVPGQKVQPRLVRESTEDTIEDTTEETSISKDMKTENGRAWFMALTDVCVVDLSVATKPQKDQLGQSAKILQKSGATPEQIVSFGEWWSSEDWRGKQGQAPTPAQVRSEWGKFTASGADGKRRVITIRG